MSYRFNTPDCYILLISKYGRRIKDNEKRIEVLPGTLLLFNNNNSDEFILETFDFDKPIELICSQSEIEVIPSLVVDLLRPIPTCHERLEVFKDKDWVRDGQKLSVGDRVYVKIHGYQEELPGTLRFKGHEVPESKGILFGIELEDAKGESDGTYKKKRLFKTKEYHSYFTHLHKVRRQRDDWQKNDRLRATENSKPPRETDECRLRIGERVVWISDTGPEKGVVKWTGCLPEVTNDKNVTVGVEFDNPVGTGTGKYKHHRLFYTKPKHASLIPLMGLMKEEEFEDGICKAEPNLSDFAQSKELIHEQEKLLAACKINKTAHSNRLPKHNFSEITQPVMTYEVPSLKSDIGSGSQLSEGRSLGETSRGPDMSGLNPLYEHSRLKEELHQEGASKLSSGSSSASSREADPDLDVGSLVEVALKTPHYGVIRWIGDVDSSGRRTAGLEMEEEVNGATDGTFKGVRYFHCATKKALFVPLYRCSKDKRFASDRKLSTVASQDFGGKPTPDLSGDVAPPDADFSLICGKNRGIQGHHNSCYLDATLFCMFYFTTVFDFIFNRRPREDDLLEYSEVQRVLRDGIVNPLRKYMYVRADKVSKLRSLLDRLGTVDGMMTEEKDPEEFLSALLTDIMKADPLLHLSSGEHTYFYQLFMEKDDKLLLPTTQKLVEMSFLQGNVKLKEVPSCFMIQMPRFGKDYKMFHRIVPSLQLDITDILENYPRDCIVCGGLAMHECTDCYQLHGPGLNTTAFCDNCVKRSHQHASRRDHQPKRIPGADNFVPMYEEMKGEALRRAQENGEEVSGEVSISLPREVMELFAVICIQTSHYVSFVKCGTGPKAPWVFFDSMADRMGEQSGYNIPEVVEVPLMSQWLDEGNLQALLQTSDDRELPEHLRRILCDGYMCMYQSPDVMMFN